MMRCPLKIRGAKPPEDQIHLQSDYVSLRAGPCGGGHVIIGIFPLGKLSTLSNGNGSPLDLRK